MNKINEFYIPINRNDYIYNKENDSLNFTERELSLIKSYINNNFLFDKVSLTFNINRLSIEFDVRLTPSKYDYIYFRIVKMRDEYYGVYYSSSNLSTVFLSSTEYKCDQLEGLFRFMCDQYGN